MSKELTKNPPKVLNAVAVQKLIIDGDLAGLSPQDRAQYYLSLCDAIGLDPHTKPFDYLRLNGKDVLYANKNAAEQLRKVYGVSTQIVEEKIIRGIYVVKVRASTPEGRVDDATGAVPIEKLVDGSDNLANALMKAETKAKRRATLSICGLGMLDETEIETISGAERMDEPYAIQIKTLPDESAKTETASRSSDVGTRGGGGDPVTAATDYPAGPAEPVAPKSAKSKPPMHSGEFAIIAVEFTPEAKYTGTVTLENIKGQQQKFSVWSETTFEVCRKSFAAGSKMIRGTYTHSVSKNGTDFFNLKSAEEIRGEK